MRYYSHEKDVKYIYWHEKLFTMYISSLHNNMISFSVKTNTHTPLTCIKRSERNVLWGHQEACLLVSAGYDDFSCNQVIHTPLIVKSFSLGARGGGGGKLVRQGERNETVSGDGPRGRYAHRFAFPAWHASASARGRSRLLTRKPLQRLLGGRGVTRTATTQSGRPEAHRSAWNEALRANNHSTATAYTGLQNALGKHQRGTFFSQLVGKKKASYREKGRRGRALKSAQEFGLEWVGTPGRRTCRVKQGTANLCYKGWQETF